MHQSLRPYVTAGVAVLGASMIAVTPGAAASAVNVYEMPDVALTAGVELGDIDFTQAWTDAFNTAGDNFTAVQAAASDASSALGEALQAADFSTLDFNQLAAAMTFLAGDQKTFINEVANNTLEGLHHVMFSVLTNPDADPPMLPTEFLPIVNFLASPLSGSLIASLGPALAPGVALLNSIHAISDNLSGEDPDYTAALQELVNIPANMVGGSLNGATLDLDALVPIIAESGLLPEDIDIEHLSFAFGGLLSPGDVVTGLVVGEGDEAVHLGGSIFNSLGLEVDLEGLSLPIDGVGVGPLAAFAQLQNILVQWLSDELPPLEPADVDPGAGVAGLDWVSGFDWLSGFDLGDLFGLG